MHQDAFEAVIKNGNQPSQGEIQPFQHPKDPDPKAARPAGFCCLSWNCKLRFSLRLWFAETMRTFISCACFHHGFFSPDSDSYRGSYFQ